MASLSTTISEPVLDPTPLPMPPPPALTEDSTVVDDYMPVPLQYLPLGNGRTLAYRKFTGHHQPTILYVPGFMSSMELPKIVNLEKYARQHGFSNVRYDQECTGHSTGSQTTIEFEHWLEDALAVVDHLCEGTIIVVASSLGGWISTLLAQRRPERIAGMIFLAPGFNCLWPGYWVHYNLLPPEAQVRVDSGEEHIKIKMRYGGIGILRKDFCERSRHFDVDFEKPIPVKCPVRIIHAVKDKDVPYEACLLLMERLATEDVDLILRKTGDHRLMSENDNALVVYELDRLIKQCTAEVDDKSSVPIRTAATSQATTLASRTKECNEDNEENRQIEKSKL